MKKGTLEYYRWAISILRDRPLVDDRIINLVMHCNKRIKQIFRIAGKYGIEDPNSIVIHVLGTRASEVAVNTINYGYRKMLIKDSEDVEYYTGFVSSPIEMKPIPMKVYDLSTKEMITEKRFEE